KTARQRLSRITSKTSETAALNGLGCWQKLSTSSRNSVFSRSIACSSAIGQLRMKTLGERIGHAADIVRHQLQAVISLGQIRLAFHEMPEHLEVTFRQKCLKLSGKGLWLDDAVRAQHAGSLPEQGHKILNHLAAQDFELQVRRRAIDL